MNDYVASVELTCQHVESCSRSCLSKTRKIYKYIKKYILFKIPVASRNVSGDNILNSDFSTSNSVAMFTDEMD